MSTHVAEILLHDGPCIVVNKPGGLPTQAPRGIDCMERRVRDYLRSREQIAGNFYLGVPHRLDRPTSGVLVFARHVRAARRISQQFEHREVQKTYWALVAGNVYPSSGVWKDHLAKVPDQPQVVAVDADHPCARLAESAYRVLEVSALFTWLEVVPLTGRMHQIRVQAASRGLPIIGDHQYGSQANFGPIEADPRRRPIALHARRLVFRHPMEERLVDVVAPLPDFWPNASETA